MNLFLRHCTAIALILLSALTGSSPVLAAATLLPNGEQCFQALTGINGMVGLLGSMTGGSGGTAGTYGGVPLTGGSGTGATANITVSAGIVTAVAILNPGSAYVVGDVLSAAPANIGNTTGFSVPVSSVAINSSLAGGKVYFYQPNTSTFKQTWFNADQSAAHQNTNPVQLDANGCAIIYGTGSYRQVLQDSLGNTVWDQITTDTSANNNTFWAGIAGGTPNVITVVDPGFNATTGSIINFTANATNTSSATLNPSSYGAIAIVKDTTNGPVSLIGGEIVQNNTVSVIYRSVDNAFHILNPVIQSASGSTAPLCGAVGYTVGNNGGDPNTLLGIGAGNVVMVSSAGQAIHRTAVGLLLNFQTNGANGLDTGSIAPSTVYYIWLIDNGAATAALASLSSAAPTLPSGYTYSCRLSAVPTDGSGHLYAISTAGNSTFLVGPSATAAFTFTGTAGTCFSSYAQKTFALLPTTAIQIIGTFISSGTAAAGIGLSSAGPAFVETGVPTQALYIPFQVFTAASQSLFFCSVAANNSVVVQGWMDSVNAH